MATLPARVNSFFKYYLSVSTGNGVISSHISVIDGGLSSSETGRNELIHQREPIMPKQEDIDSDCEVIGDDTVPLEIAISPISSLFSEWHSQKSTDSFHHAPSAELRNASTSKSIVEKISMSLSLDPR